MGEVSASASIFSRHPASRSSGEAETNRRSFMR
jgi:hypothetical protein